MPDRARTFGVVLPTLLVAHNVADHVVQTDHQAANKARDFEWKAPLAGHVATYTATSAVALAAVAAGTGVRPRLGRAVVALAFSAATHAFLDRRWPVSWILRRTGSPNFATSHHVPMLFGSAHDGVVVTDSVPLPLHGPYLADQALHHGCLLIAALIAAGGRRA